MRRLWVILFILLFACRSFAPLPAPTFPAPSVVLETPFLPFGAAPDSEVEETAAAPTLPAPRFRAAAPYSVRIHPDGRQFVGDWLSFEVMAAEEPLPIDAKVQIQLNDGAIKPLAEAPVAPFGIGGRLQATFTWAWDTRGLQAGDYDLVFSVQPGRIAFTETITLLPQNELPAVERGAAWASATSDCCTLYYVTGTAAERDLPELLDLADEQAEEAEGRLGVQFSSPVTITLLPRLLGQGGFANDEIHISYLDRNYSAGSTAIILHHEMIHILDSRLGGELRPSLLTEGLAVYLSGGHFKPEPLLPRAVVLLDPVGNSSLPGLGWYVPLEELADHFYAAQHEIGYLEAGALVEYMVSRWGWQAFSTFYRDIHPHPSGRQAEAVEASLMKHFNLTLDGLEAAFLERLQHQPVEPGLLEDVRQTVNFYDSMRRYQQLLDPSAYFMTAWLPDTREMRQRNILADYLRQPVETANLALEILLAETGADLAQGRFGLVEQNLGAVNRVLDAMEQGEPEPFTRDQKAFDYYQIVQALQRGRFYIDPYSRGEISPQRIEVNGNQAQAWISLDGPELIQVTLVRTPGGWWFRQFWEGN